MKLDLPHFRRINYPKIPVPFEQYLPLKLRNTVSGKGHRENNVACVQEMFVMFSCLKKNDFNNESCPEEIRNLQKCYTKHLEVSKKHDEYMRSGVPQPGAKKLNHLQLNTLLKKYPT